MNIENVKDAYCLIKAQVERTPVLLCPTLSAQASQAMRSQNAEPVQCPRVKLFFKCENFQRSGSFKFRGASHCLARLNDEELRQGLVTQSTGNHAIALTLAAKALSEEKGFPIPVHVVLPHIATPSKISATKANGGIIHYSGYTLQERQDVASKVQEATGGVYIPPSDHRNILLGQGTAMLEFLEQLDEIEEGLLDCVVTPCGGGGLLAGTAVACKHLPLRVFGAEPSESGADDVVRGLKAKKRVETVDSLTVADGLRSPVGPVNWQVISDKGYVDCVFSVSDDEIKQAMKLVLETMKIFIEPSAAVPLAAILYNTELQQILSRDFGTLEVKIGLILTGGNTSVAKIVELFKDLA